MKGEKRLIQSVQRALDIISCFDESNSHLTINQISHLLDLHINTTRGLVNTLVYNGYLLHNVEEENNYSLGYIFIPKAELVSLNSVDRLKNIAKPYLKEIANKYQVSSRLQLVSNYNIFTVETFNPENSRYLLLTKMNTPFPLNAASSGKLFLYYQDAEFKNSFFNDEKLEKYTPKTITSKEVLLKELEMIGSQGYSFEDEEISPGMSSIAVPLIDAKEKMIGSISIVASKSFIDDIKESVINDMFDAAKVILKEINIENKKSI
ncbi:MAG: IclR family transcriptional regulator [Bacillota bacterium]